VKKIVLMIFILALPSLSLSEYMDIKKDALKSCQAYNRLHQRISKTQHVRNSNNIRLKKGYFYRVIEYRRDADELRIEIDYISQGNIRHRWVKRDCLFKNKNISK